MADLIRTVDAGEEEEASEDEAAPVLAAAKRRKVGASNFFRDIAGDDEGGGGGWDFRAAAAAADAEGAVASGGLRAKIKERLKLRKGSAEEDDAGDAAEEEAGAKKAATKAAAKEAAKAARGTAEHLRTDIHFADLRLSRPLLRAVTTLGFDSPTPIQRDVIPPALQGLDILATAETGSGKTASFLLPCLERLCQSASVRSRRRDASGRVVTGPVGTKAMILIPTRELAVQCHAMLKDLSQYTMVTCQLVTGGFESTGQATSLRQQPDLVVATPGRILDHLLNTQSVHMELLEIVVFDEADRLLELGFRDECLQVLSRCSKGRQTMLFSATMNTSVEDLASLALVKPVRVHASPINRVAETLEQEFVKAPSEDLREAVLLSLCTRNYTTKTIIFCATKQAAHRLAIIFGLLGLNFAEIHGNLAQADRVRALDQFQAGEVDFLLATDLAARGLDLPNVETVINFHLPVDISRYIHRVGRTARMGRTGRAVTVYVNSEYARVKKLGKQCATKVKSKVIKRTIAGDAVKSWSEKVAGLEEDIKGIGDEEAMERELRLADILASRSENIQKHKQDIQARPAKTWIMTNNEKRKLKEADGERVKKAAEEFAIEEEAPAQAGKRKQRGDQRSPEERREAKTRERLKQRKAQETAERLASQARVRASARRQRKASRPGGKGPAEAAPQGGGGGKKKGKKGKKR
eukprot:TRINITY_DN74574_c0_g1_i1.p1 TRINITY_DN74574_c0_g1~~TRINITY_DN74574_c0_g1_i1.p1  ORF type:complete len:711 (+),score=206.19 TRINITY_DN74574_c0_g1_i1:46-2133(+)